MAATDSLNSILNSYSVYALRTIADNLGVENPIGIPKELLLKRIGRDVGKPDVVAKSLAELSTLQRQVLDVLMLAGRPLMTDTLQFQLRGVVDEPARRERSFYGVTRAPEPGDPNKPNSTYLPDIVAALSASGLAFAQPSSATAGVSELGLRDIVTIPDKVRKALLSSYPDTPASYDPTGETIQERGPRQLYRDMFRLWNLIRRKPVMLTTAGILRKTDARALGIALGLLEAEDDEFSDENDLPYLTFLREEMARLGLLLPNGQRIEAASPGEAGAYFSRPWPERTLALLHDWIAGKVDSKIADIYFPGIGQIRLGPEQFGRTDRKLLAHLLRLPEGWVRLADFSTVLRLHDPEFLVASPERSYGYGLGYGGDEWTGREGQIITMSITGVLAWFGLVDLALDKSGTPSGFRLNAPGRALITAELAGQTTISPEALPDNSGDMRVIVQPNFQVLAVGDTDDSVLLRLSQVAELVRIDQAVELKLTRASVQAAQQAGWSADEIIGFLREVSGAPLAQNVERSLRDWTAALDRILIRRNAGLLLALDPALIDSTERAESAREWIGARPLPAAALLRSPDASRSIGDLRNALAQSGELPALTDIRKTGPHPSFQFDTAGLVSFRAPLPDLRLLGLLATVAAPGDEGLALSEARTRASAAARRWKIEDVNELLEELARWHVGPLPTQIGASIKSWSGFYGRAELRTITLLVVEREDLLQELSADPAIGALLTPLTAAGAAAIIGVKGSVTPTAKGRGKKGASPATPNAPSDADALEQLRKLLAERGFSVD